MSVFFLGVLVFLGWWIVAEVVFSIVKVYSRSRNVLEHIGQQPPALFDEVESINAVINGLSTKVKTTLEQLKEFSETTEELNKEISKKVFVLTTILQAHELFSKQTPTETVVKFIVQSIREILEMKMSFCFFTGNGGYKFKAMDAEKDSLQNIERFFAKMEKSGFQIKGPGVADSQKKTQLWTDWTKDLGVQNIAVVPISLEGNVVGLLGIGKDQDRFVFTKDDLDVLILFSQYIAFVWEHEKLLLKVEELEIFDYLTSLYNEKFIMKRLEEEIQRAIIYRRPCGFLVMKIANYDQYQKEFGIIEAEKLLKKIAGIFKEILRAIDIKGRMGADTFAAILIEKNKRQSQEIAKSLKEKLDFIFKDKANITIAVAENPLDGINAAELLSFACAHLNSSETNGAT